MYVTSMPCYKAEVKQVHAFSAKQNTQSEPIVTHSHCNCRNWTLCIRRKYIIIFWLNIFFYFSLAYLFVCVFVHCNLRNRLTDVMKLSLLNFGKLPLIQNDTQMSLSNLICNVQCEQNLNKYFFPRPKRFWEIFY